MTSKEPVNNNDRISVWMNILCWFIPIVGIILYFKNREEKPIRSKSNLKVSIVSICVTLGIALIVAFFVGKASYEYNKTHPVLHNDEFWDEYDWDYGVEETEEEETSDLSLNEFAPAPLRDCGFAIDDHYIIENITSAFGPPYEEKAV